MILYLAKNGAGQEGHPPFSVRNAFQSLPEPREKFSFHAGFARMCLMAP
jgi:hypothetical protein